MKIAIGAIRVLVHELPAFSHDPALFRACHEPFARRIFEIATPGICDADPSHLDCRHLPRPIHPFHPQEEVERAFRAGRRGNGD